jgi:hydrogenase nickel incorporation protein HypA/HybF
VHELSIAISLLEVAGEEAQRHGGGRVLAIHLRLGPLSGVVKEALLGAFELAREGTEMDGCRLIIKEIPIVIDCAVCGGHRPARSIQDICCDVCGTPTMDIISGRELDVVAMELSDEHANSAG